MTEAALQAPDPVSHAGPLIRVAGLNAGFDDQAVLTDVSLQVPRSGIVAVMGPGGVGKTTLVRTLGRWNDPLPSFWVRGSIELDGRDVLAAEEVESIRRMVPLLAQKARLYTATVLENVIAEVRGETLLTIAQKRDLARASLEPLGLWGEFERHLDAPVLSLSIGRQRMISVARLLAGESRCLLADEPLRDLSEADARDLEALLRSLSDRWPVVMVTHNQGEARRMSQWVALVTAGRLVELSPTDEFFREPRSELGRQFLGSGNCWPREERAGPDSGSRAERGPAPSPRAQLPSGFHWIRPGQLAGTQWPGLLSEEENDLAALATLGTRVLVSLTESPFPTERLARHDISGIHFPIVDMGIPDLAEAATLCREISDRLDAGEVVVLHCKAGLGRTGTLLACVLVHGGHDAVGAIHRVRCTNPRYIQSEVQLDFVSRFASFVERRR